MKPPRKLTFGMCCIQQLRYNGDSCCLTCLCTHASGTVGMAGTYDPTQFYAYFLGLMASEATGLRVKG